MTSAMDRREFVLVSASALSLGACAGVRYVAPTIGSGRLVISAAALADDGQAFLQTPEMPRPVYLRRSESGVVAAASSNVAAIFKPLNMPSRSMSV